MWRLGLWPRSSFSGNICFQFSILVFCSAARVRILNVWTKRNAANYYKSFTIFDSHHGPFTVADGVLFGVGSGLGWYDSKIRQTHQRKKPQIANPLLCRNGCQRADVFRILMDRFSVADGVLAGAGSGLGLGLSPGTSEVAPRPLLSLPGLQLSQFPRGDHLWWTR